MKTLNSKSSTHLKVHTSFGSFFASANEKYLIPSNGGYIQRPISELQGEYVLLGRSGIKIDQETSEKILLKLPRYIESRSVLFYQNPDGSFTTKLSKIINPENKDSSEVASKIHSHLSMNGVSITIDHIKTGWLGGEVVKPQNPLVLEKLVSIYPNLSELQSPEFQKAYDLYMTIRRSAITAAQNRFSIKTDEPSTGSVSVKKISLSPEIEFLIKELGYIVSDQFVAARIDRIDSVSQIPTISDEISYNGTGLFRGLVTSKNFNPPIKSDRRLVDEYRVLELLQISLNLTILLFLENQIKIVKDKDPNNEKIFTSSQIVDVIMYLEKSLECQYGSLKRMQTISNQCKNLTNSSSEKSLADRIYSYYNGFYKVASINGLDFSKLINCDQFDSLFDVPKGLYSEFSSYRNFLKRHVPSEYLLYLKLREIYTESRISKNEKSKKGPTLRALFANIKKQCVDLGLLSEPYLSEYLLYDLLPDMKNYAQIKTALLVGSMSPLLLLLFSSTQQINFTKDSQAFEILSELGFDCFSKFFLSSIGYQNLVSK